ATRPPRTDLALFVVNVDGTGLRQISSWGSKGISPSAGWSPDGTTILFNKNCNLFKVHPDGTGLAQISMGGVGDPGCAFQPGWSPDGTRIVFGMVTRSGSGPWVEGIYTARADGTDFQQVTNSTTSDDGADWGPHTLAG